MKLYETLKNTGKRYSPAHGVNMLGLIRKLESGKEVTDELVLNVFKEFENTVQSSADSVAQGLFSCAAILCVHKPNLAVNLLAVPLRALYYLGIESFEEIKQYIKWFVSYDSPYMGKGPDASYEWLYQRLQNDDKIFVEAFRLMYEREENDWREDEPEILKAKKVLPQDNSAE